MQTVDRILCWTTRLGVFLVPFIPLIISASLFFPFITGKNFAFRIITEIIFAAWLLLALRKPEFRPKTSAVSWSVAAFVGVMLIADSLAENPFKALWSNFERMEGFITLAHLGLYFLVASSVLNSEKLWTRYFATSVGVSAFLGIYGILQLAGKIVINQGGVRLDGTFGNAAYFAGYMLFHIFLTLFLLFRHKVPPVGKWLYGGALALQFFTLIFTATRGAAVGLVAGLLFSLLCISICERQNRRLRRGALCGLALLIIVVGGIYALRDSRFIKEIRRSPALRPFPSKMPDRASWCGAWRFGDSKSILCLAGGRKDSTMCSTNTITRICGGRSNGLTAPTTSFSTG